MSKFEKSFEKAMRAAAPQRALPGDLQLRRALERTGVAHLGPVSVKIVQHPSGEEFAVETTVGGDRRYPREPPMSMEEARSFAIQQLASPRASQTEELAPRSDEEKWSGILEANPVLSDPKFASGVKRWNKLKEIADARGLRPDEAVGFIAEGMKQATAGPAPSRKTRSRCGNPLCGAPLDERGACVDACGWKKSPTPRDPMGREYVPAGTLAARYRARGIPKQTAWGNFVRDTIVSPVYSSDPIDAKEFYRLYEGRSR